MAELEIERWRYPRFFTENIDERGAILMGDEPRHAVQVLRMRSGDLAVLCDGKGTDYLARLESADKYTCRYA